MRQKQVEIIIPDAKNIFVSPFGSGGDKLGPDVRTYSKFAITTCPGASKWCRKHCCSKSAYGPLYWVYEKNTLRGQFVPQIPPGTRFLRWHVSGDFDSNEYISEWLKQVIANPDCKFWGYTRSWRIPPLLPALESLRSQPNVQLFASMDESIGEAPPTGWRIAWIQYDPRAEGVICLEQAGIKKNCQECGYCLGGTGHLIFVKV